MIGGRMRKGRSETRRRLRGREWERRLELRKYKKEG